MEKQIFTQGEKLRLWYNLTNTNISVLYSKYGSDVNDFIFEVLNENQSKIDYVGVMVDFLELKKQEISPKDFVIQKVREIAGPTNLIDKIFEDDESFWFNFKRFSANHKDTTIFLFFKNFDYFFDLDTLDQKVFLDNLQGVLQNIAPSAINDSMQQILSGNSDKELSSQGFSMLLSNFKISCLITIDKHNLFLLNQLVDRFSGIYSNVLEISDTNDNVKSPSIVERIKENKFFVSHKRPILIGCLSVLAVLFTFSLVSFQSNPRNEISVDNSKSRSLASYSFQVFEDDPTLSLRLAQKSYEYDKNDEQAYTAILNSFYKANTFYDIVGYLDEKSVSTNLTAKSNLLLSIQNDDERELYSLSLINPLNASKIAEIPHKQQITSCVCDSRGERIITTSYDSTIRIFNRQGQLLFKDNSSSQSVLWCSDISKSNYFVTGSESGYVFLYDNKSNLINKIYCHDLDVYCVKFSNSGDKFATASRDNVIKLWSIDGKLLNTYCQSKDNNVMISSVVFSPDDKKLLVSSNNYDSDEHLSLLWDIDGTLISKIECEDDWLNYSDFSLDGQSIITSSKGKNIRLYDLNGKQTDVLKGHRSEVLMAKYLAKDLIISCGYDKTIRLWPLGKRVESYPHSQDISKAIFSPDGINLLLVRDSSAMLWDLTGETIVRYEGHTGLINSAIFNKNSSKVLTCADDNRVILFDKNGQKLADFNDGAYVYSAIISFDDKFVISSNQRGRLMSRNLQTGFAKHKDFSNFEITCMCFHPSQYKFVAGTTDNQVLVFNLNLDIIQRLEGHSKKINSVSYSSDGKYIISTSSDETASIWDTCGNRIQRINGYLSKVNSAVFSPDNKFILTASEDGNAILYSFSGTPIMTFTHNYPVSSAVFSPNGNYILSVLQNSPEGNLKLRLVDPQSIIRQIDTLNLYGKIWNLDNSAKSKYGLQENSMIN